MQMVTIFFLGLLVAGLVLTGLAVKAMAHLLIEPVPLVRKLVTWPVALLALLLGAATTASTIEIVLPASWGDAADWVWIPACGLSAVLAVWPVVARKRGVAAGMAAPAPLAAGMACAPVLAVGKQQAWPHCGLDGGLADIRAARKARANVLSTVLLVIAVPLAGYCGLKYGWFAFGCVVAATLVLILQWYSTIGGMSEREYRTLPGSTDASGRHRCVYCGKWGVYRHGAYASNSTWHQCTGCRKHLFVD